MNAGWHEGSLYIYSDAADGAATEIYRLEEDGRTLVIEIEVKMAGGQTRKFSRVFERTSGV